jgi:hypothetical protein
VEHQLMSLTLQHVKISRIVLSWAFPDVSPSL